MLQPAGDSFRVHDLVLRFLKLKLKADSSRPTATCRTAEYLGQLKILRKFFNAEETNGGVYSFMALWRSVESLAEESHVEAVYTNLDGVPDSAPWRQAGRLLELMVSRRSNILEGSTKRFSVGRCSAEFDVISHEECGVCGFVAHPHP